MNDQPHEARTARPRINLEPERVICAKHGEPFRLTWPAGYPVFVVEGIQALVAMKTFSDECGGDVGTANRLLDLQPLCCRLGRNGLLTTFTKVHKILDERDASPWTWAKCIGCKQYAVGFRLKGFGQICFPCFLDKCVARRLPA